MAIVKITDELIRGVCGRLDAALEPACAEAARQRPDIGRACLERVLGPYKERLAATPTCWLVPCVYMYLIARNVKAPSAYQEYTLDPPMLIPLALDANDIIDRTKYRTSGNSVTLELISSIVWRDEVDMLVEWNQKMVDAAAKKRAAKENAVKLLTQFKTLAPALKAWPALWDLLPEHYKERHRLVAERGAKPAPADVSKDLEKLNGVTALLAAAKMGVK